MDLGLGWGREASCGGASGLSCSCSRAGQGVVSGKGSRWPTLTHKSTTRTPLSPQTRDRPVLLRNTGTPAAGVRCSRSRFCASSSWRVFRFSPPRDSVLRGCAALKSARASFLQEILLHGPSLVPCLAHATSAPMPVWRGFTTSASSLLASARPPPIGGGGGGGCVIHSLYSGLTSTEKESCLKRPLLVRAWSCTSRGQRRSEGFATKATENLGSI